MVGENVPKSLTHLTLGFSWDETILHSKQEFTTTQNILLFPGLCAIATRNFLLDLYFLSNMT